MASDRPQPPALPAELSAILATRGAQREDMLLASDHLEDLVPRLAPEALFFTLSGMSQENVPAVLSQASSEQLEFLLDLDLWHKDRVRPDRAVPWLRLLVRCGDPALQRWLPGLDLADLTLLLGQLARVQVVGEDEDPLQDAPGRMPFTLDGMYYVSAGATEEPLLRRLLTVLHAASSEQYYRLMEALIRDLDSELEEHCFEARQRRLATRGFPEWEEAMEVYARLDVAALGQLPVRTVFAEPADPGVVPPHYPVLVAGASGGRLAGALEALPTGTAPEPLQSELAYLTHKVAVADSLDLGQIEALETAARKVAAYVSIGLEALCGTDPARCAEALCRHWLQHLFRVGWTRIRRVRTRARRVIDKGWPQGHKERLLFLDEPLPRILEGLLMSHPRWYDAGEAGYRRFSTLDEVRAAEWAVGKLEFLGQFLLGLVDLRLGDLREALVRLDTENLKGSTVFLTSLVNAALDQGFRFTPVPRDQAGAGLARVWETDHPPRRVRPELADTAVEWARSVRPMTAQEEAFLTEFVQDSFSLLEEEFGHLAEDEVPDPRFTRGLWIE
jgi:hypothetical protein